MAYLYLFLSSACSLTIAHLLKLTEVRGQRTLNTLTVNYLVALLFALPLGYRGESGNAEISSILLFIFCLIVGAFFIGNFVSYGKSVHANGVGVTVAAMRLSLMVPVLVSLIFYAEFLSESKIIGIFLAFGALILLVPKRKGVQLGGWDASWLLVIVFLLSGFADASLKIYQEEFSSGLHELTFMGFVFAGAFFIGLILCLIREGPLFTRQELVLGAVIGIPNLYSSVFLIYALQYLSGALAFPIVNILNVVGGTLLGLLVWKDSISHLQKAGLVVAIVAILFLV